MLKRNSFSPISTYSYTEFTVIGFGFSGFNIYHPVTFNI